jgi:hypothetical protein
VRCGVVQRQTVQNGVKDQKNCTLQFKGEKVREIFMKAYANLLSCLLYFIFS